MFRSELSPFITPPPTIGSCLPAITGRIVASLFALAIAGAATAADYSIVDTGQSLCYDTSGDVISCQIDTLAGQDASHAGNAPSYVDNGDGTISDLVTGLMWQKTPTADVTEDEAIDGASPAFTGGYDDWRLPTIKEMYSLIDFSGYGGTSAASSSPFIDTDFFEFAYGNEENGERFIDAQYVTSTRYVSTTMNGDETVFGVNFADGRIKGYPALMPGGSAKTFEVLYVRGNPDYGRNEFRDNGDGTVSDLATSLMWSQDDSGLGMDWQEALAWVAERNDEGWLGHDDWRLPNAKELQSILDYSRSPDTTQSAAIDPIFASSTLPEGSISSLESGDDYPFYWTSTTHLDGPADTAGSGAIYLCFGEAAGYMNGQWLDVHGAGAQRSDPKTGDAADWPFGHGPQGDVIRIDNFVRLVRDEAVTIVQSSVQWLPVVARVQGAGAFFTSRLEIFNASGEILQVLATFTPRKDFNGAAISVDLELEPGIVATIDDPLSSWFGISEDAVGSLRLEAQGGSQLFRAQVVVSARPGGADDSADEYGQVFVAAAESEALQAGQTAWLPTTVDAQRTRINVAALALDDQTQVLLRLVDPVSLAISTDVDLSLDAGESVQRNDLATLLSMASSAIENTLIEVQIVSGRAFVFASVLDGNGDFSGSSDPTTLLPVTVGSDRLTLLELGSIQGLDEFAGSASVSNLTTDAALVAAEFYLRDQPGIAASASFTLAGGETIGWRDLVLELFGVSGSVGTVVFTSSQEDSLMASGREYAIRRDEAGEITSTAGQSMPGLGVQQLITPGSTAHFIGLGELNSSSGLRRSHLAVFNPSTELASLALLLIDAATGRVEGTASLSVEGGELKQLDRIISTMTATLDGQPKRLELETDRSVYAAAFRVEASGDPITIAPWQP